MASPGHRQNILTAAYEDVGIGIVPGVPVAGIDLAGATYTTEFGYRRPAATATKTATAKKKKKKRRHRRHRRSHR